jgi:hypothetical protein
VHISMMFCSEFAGFGVLFVDNSTFSVSGVIRESRHCLFM